MRLLKLFVKFQKRINIHKDSLYKKFFDQIKDKCGLIINKNKYEEIALDYVKEKFTIWVAHWDVEKPTYKGTYHVWQYTVGSTPGVTGRCDLDKGYLDFEPIMKQYGLNGY